MDLTKKSPAQIDEALAEIYSRVYKIDDEIQRFIGYRKNAEKGLSPHYWNYRESDADKINEAIDKYEARITSLRLEMVAVKEETDPYEVEFARRGGWTRAWLVDNQGGHVHNTMGCSTCYPTTRFGWLPQVSGLPEAEIVALAGDGACTICYPSAPAAVKNNPNPIRLELPARKAAREIREKEKAERLAKKIAKSVTLDGSDLVIHTTYFTERIKTLVTAKRLLADHFGAFGSHVADNDLPILVEAIAAKEAKTTGAVIAEARQRAAKKDHRP